MTQVQPSITCPQCGNTSYNPNDIREGYCGYCHWWTSDPDLGPHFAAVQVQVEQGAAAMQEGPGYIRQAIASVVRAYRR